jgi:hypothetical protein
MMEVVPLNHTSPMMDVMKNQHIRVSMTSALAAQNDDMELLY